MEKIKTEYTAKKNRRIFQFYYYYSLESRLADELNNLLRPIYSKIQYV